MKRIVFIDIAKAICIILVVIGHYIPDNSPEWYVTLHDVIYTFHMPLFMFASGYVYMATRKSEDTYVGFMTKKAKRLMIPYFATSIIVVTLKMLTQGNMAVDNPVSLTSYIKILYQPEAGYFLWFIWALWWMFLLVPLFRTSRQRMFLFFISIALFCLPVTLPRVFCLYEFKRMLVFFMLGVVSFEQKWLHDIICRFNTVQTLSSIALFAMVQYVRHLCGGGIIMAILLPCMGIVAVIEISKWLCHQYRVDGESKVLILSASSYIIYLFHTTFEGLTKAVFQKLPIDSDVWYVFIPEALIVVTCGVVVPILLYVIFKRYRITKILFGL